MASFTPTTPTDGVTSFNAAEWAKLNGGIVEASGIAEARETTAGAQAKADAAEADAIAAAATDATTKANAAQAAAVQRANHTGAQAVSTVTGLQAALDAKAPTASPTFTGTVSGVTKTHVGLGNVDNTADAAKPVSTAQQTALDAKVSSATVDNIVTLTEAAYTALGTKDPATLYLRTA